MENFSNVPEATKLEALQPGLPAPQPRPHSLSYRRGVW